MKREVVALILLPLFYLYIMKLSVLFFFLLLVLLVVISQMEFYSMYNVDRPMAIVGVFAGTFFLYNVFSKTAGTIPVLSISVLLFFVFRLMYVSKGPKGALGEIAPVVVGFLYIPVVLSLLLKIRQYGPEWIIYTATTIWGADSFAYYFGKNLGRRKLYPSVSPKKTVEGAAGSVVGGIVCSVILSAVLLKIQWYHAVLLGLFLGCIAVIGDLTESMFKRDAGVKDSSELIPGHGGVLDKIDGLIFATPVVYLFLSVF